MSNRRVQSIRLSSLLRSAVAVTPKPALSASDKLGGPTWCHAAEFVRIAAVLLIAIAAVCPPGAAQTAHFSGARSRAVSDPQKPVGEAVRRDSTPASNFGSVKIGATSTPMSLTFTFDAAVTLGSTSAVTQGAPNLDFADAGTGTCTAGTAYSSGNTCTVDVTFAPTRSGARYGAAVLFDGAGNPIATGYLQGAGSGPQIEFTPGTESTVPTSGLQNPRGLAVDGNGNVYVSEYAYNGRVLKETLAAKSYTQSTMASLFIPEGLAVDGAGNVYIVDDTDQAFKETWTGSGYIQSTVTSDLNELTPGLAVDGSGNVFIADLYGGNLLKEALSADGYVESQILYCGFTGEWECPSSVAVDASENLYVTSDLSSYDFNGSEVLMMTPSAGGYTQSWIGSGLYAPGFIVVDGNGNLYVADCDNGRVVKETLSAGSYIQSTVPASNGAYPEGVAVDGNGNLYIADSTNSRVLKEDYWDPPSIRITSANDGPQTVTIENNGNAPLIFPVPSAGTNPSISPDFTLDSSVASACPVVSAGASSPGSLAAGTSCTLNIGVASVGTLSGSLVLTDNNLNAPAPGYATQTIALAAVVSSRTTLAVSSTQLQSGQPLTLTATVTGATGSATPTGNVTFSGVSSPSPSTALSGSGVATWTSSTLAAGNYSATASFAGDATHNPSQSQPVSFTVAVGPPAKVIPVGGPDWAGTYGSAINICAEVTDVGSDPLPGNIVTFSGTGLTFTPSSGVSNAGGQVCTVVTTPSPLGDFVAMASAAGLSNPAIFNLTVNPAPLTVRMLNRWRPYGAANPKPAATVRGLVNGDTLGGTVIVTAQTAATPASPVGYYPWTSPALSGTSAGNYTATFVDIAVLGVYPAPLQIFPGEESSFYGQTPAQPTNYRLRGFVNGDTGSVVSGAPVLTTTVTSNTPVGVYKIESEIGTLTAANYTFFALDGALRVYHAPLTVTANSFTIQQGQPIPTLTYSIGGFVNGDTQAIVSGAPEFITLATSTSPPGVYTITIRPGTLSAPNYKFPYDTMVSGTLTIQ